MNFEDLAKFPMQDEDDWIKTVVIGGVLALLGFFIIPMLIVWGYVVEVMRGGVAGEAEPPQFDEWGELAVDGLKAFVITLAYQIVPAIVGIAVIFISTLLFASGGDAGAGLGFLGLLFSFVVWGVLSFVFGYVGMAGVVNFAVEGSIGAGFDFGTITSVATTSDWLMAWAFYVGLSIVAGIVGSVTGGLGSPFATFYALSAGGRAFGEAFSAATGVEAVVEESATATTA